MWISFKSIFCVAALFFCFKSNANLNPDSLLNIANNSKQRDTARVSALLQLSQHYMSKKENDALLYANQALQMSYKINDTIKITKSLLLIADYQFKVEQNYDTTLYFLRKSLRFADNTKQDHIKAEVLRKIGLTHYFQGSNDTALVYFNRSLPLFIRAKDSAQLIQVNNNIGAVLMDTDNPKQALKYFYQALYFNERKGDSIAISSNYNNIGLVLLEAGDFGSAKYYFDKSIGIRIRKTIQHLLRDHF